MRIIRLLLRLLAAVLGLAVLLFVAAFAPPVQTWYFNRILAAHPELHLTVGNVSARFSAIELTDVRFVRDGVVLTLPSVEARLPMVPALWHHEFHIQRVLANGWTLDLGNTPGRTDGSLAPNPSGAGPSRSSAATSFPPGAVGESVARNMRSLLRDWRLPSGASLDGIVGEGDVLLPSQDKPAKIHVILKGGGLAREHPGEFTVDASAGALAPALPFRSVSARGRGSVFVTTEGQLGAIEYHGTIVPDGSTAASELTLAARVGLADETLALELTRGTRRLASITASRKAGRVSGPWKIELREEDVALFTSAPEVYRLSASGNGEWDANLREDALHLAGKLDILIARWRETAGFGPASMTLQSDFDFRRLDGVLQVTRLNVTLGGEPTTIRAHATQPFSFNPRNRALEPSNPESAWLAGTLQGVPLDWLPIVGDLTLAGSTVTGDFSVLAGKDGFAVRSEPAFSATRVTVQGATTTLVRELDITLAVVAHFSPGKDWDAVVRSLTGSHAGRRLMTFEGRLQPLHEKYRHLAVTGKWQADLGGLRTQPGFQWLGRGKSAAGEFSAKLSPATDLNANLTIDGQSPAQVVTMKLSAAIDDYMSASIRAPVTLGIGAGASEFTVTGTWAKQKTGHRVDLEFSGVKVAAEHLVLLASALPLPGDQSVPAIVRAWAGAPAPQTKDPAPFWGDVTGRVAFDFRAVRTASHPLQDLRGTLDITSDAIRINGGRASILWDEEAKNRARDRVDEPSTVLSLAGAVEFVPTADRPYRLTVNASADPIDATHLFGLPAAGHEVSIEGRFALARVIKASGLNLADLAAHHEERFELRGDNGILRLLKTSVADALTEPETPVADTFASIGSALGTLLGHKGSAPFSHRTDITPATEAALDVARLSSEIGYRKFSVAAVRASNGSYHLSDIDIEGENHRLTGAGEIAANSGTALSGRPMQLDLRLAVGGFIAKRAATAGLLAPAAEPDGFTFLKEPIHLGGSLQQIDVRQWHDFLVKTALPPKPSGKSR